MGSIIERMAEAIKHFEGWFPASRSFRNNNPGNLRQPVNMAGWFPPGATGIDDTRHFIFDSYESGWNALLHQLNLAFSGRSYVYSPSMSIYDFFSKYAEKNQVKYAQSVASQLGVTPDTKLEDLV